MEYIMKAPYSASKELLEMHGSQGVLGQGSVRTRDPKSS